MPTEVNFVNTLIANPKLFIEKYLHIETTPERVKALVGQAVPVRGNIYPFIFSEEQSILYNIYQKLRKERKPIRIIYLKSRQTCSTTFWTALCFAHMICHPNTKAFIVANLDQIKEQLYRKIELFFNDLPPELKPTVKQFSQIKGITFDDSTGQGLHSEIGFAVSANKDAGAGSTRHWFLGTEVARWFFPEEIMLSVMPSIPDEPETAVILESTARGHGNYFHQSWLEAKQGRGAFKAIFIPWFVHKYYQKKLDQKWFDIPLDTIEEYQPEKELVTRYNLSSEQLYWRRESIDNNCQSDPLKFCQEYPSTDIEAFISVELNVFNVRKLQQLYLLCEKGQRGEIKDGSFSPVYNGLWEIWEKPQGRVTYIFGVDSGTGIVDGDPNVILVLRADTLDVVAEFSSHQEATPYANLLVEGAKFYNNAFCVIEITGGSGLAVLERVKQIPYYNLYLWERIDQFGKVITNKLGFETSGGMRGSKQLLINDIRDYINFNYGKIRSKSLIDEMMSYIETSTGKMGAVSSCYDDRVMAFGLALRGYRSNQRRWEPAIKPNKSEEVEYNFYPERNIIEVPFVRKEYQRVGSSMISTPYGNF